MTDEEKAALTAAATQARSNATAAQKAADDAGGTDEALNAAAATAHTAAQEAEAAAGGEVGDDELDLDKELEEEERRGKPDPDKAAKAFKEREDRRKEAEREAAEAAATAQDDDKPLTRKDIAEIEQRAYARLQADRAAELARAITTTEKEAQLVLAKWKNRTFPASLPLADQLDEAYAIVHRKKMIGERNEALRAIKGKQGVQRNAAETHFDAPTPGEPKLGEHDKAAMTAAGFGWDGTKKLFTKKLKNGRTLATDAKRSRTWMVD